VREKCRQSRRHAILGLPLTVLGVSVRSEELEIQTDQETCNTWAAADGVRCVRTE
jgi:hypothetical protein